MNKNKSVGRPFKEVKMDKKQEIRCSEEEKQLWALAAKLSEHKNTSDYMRDVVNQHAKGVIAKLVP